MMNYLVLLTFTIASLCTHAGGGELNSSGEYVFSKQEKRFCKNKSQKIIKVINKGKEWRSIDTLGANTVDKLNSLPEFASALDNFAERFSKGGSDANLSNNEKSLLINQACLDSTKTSALNWSLREGMLQGGGVVDPELIRETNDPFFQLSEESDINYLLNRRCADVNDYIDCAVTRSCRELVETVSFKPGKPFTTNDGLKLCAMSKEMYPSLFEENTKALAQIASYNLDIRSMIDYADLTPEICECLDDERTPLYKNISSEEDLTLGKDFSDAIKEEMIKEIKNDYTNHIENLASKSYFKNGDDQDVNLDHKNRKANKEVEKKLCMDHFETDKSCPKGAPKKSFSNNDLSKILGHKAWGVKDAKLTSNNPLKALRENLENEYNITKNQSKVRLFGLDSSFGVFTGVINFIGNDDNLFNTFVSQLNPDGSHKRNFYDATVKAFDDEAIDKFKKYLSKDGDGARAKIFTNSYNGISDVDELSKEQILEVISHSLLVSTRLRPSAEYLVSDNKFAYEYMTRLKKYSDRKNNNIGEDIGGINRLLTKADNGIHHGDFVRDAGMKNGQNADISYSALFDEKVASECKAIADKMRTLLCYGDSDLRDADFLSDEIHSKSLDNISSTIAEPDKLLKYSCNRFQKQDSTANDSKLFKGSPKSTDIVNVSDAYLCSEPSAARRCSVFSTDARFEKFKKDHPELAGYADALANQKSIASLTDPNNAEWNTLSSSEGGRAYASGNNSGRRALFGSGFSGNGADLKESSRISSNISTTYNSSTPSFSSSQPTRQVAAAGVSTSGMNSKSSESKESSDKSNEAIDKNFDNSIKEFVQSPTYQQMSQSEKDAFMKKLEEMQNIIKSKDLKIAQLKNQELQDKIKDLTNKYEDLEKKINSKEAIAKGSNNNNTYSNGESSGPSSASISSGRSRSTSSAPSVGGSVGSTSGSRAIASTGSAGSSGSNASAGGGESYSGTGFYLVSSNVGSFPAELQDQEIREFFNSYQFTDDDISKYIDTKKGIVKVPLENGEEYEVPLDKLSDKTKKLISQLTQDGLSKADKKKLQVSGLKESKKEVKKELDQAREYQKLYAKLLESVK